MNEFATSLRLKVADGKKLLSIFLTAGYPSREATVPLLQGIAEAGADVIELGVPFSDPIADGPVIQQSSDIALRNGMTIDAILSCVREARKTTPVPIVLMGYLNPVLAYGMERFMRDCGVAGVNGTIIADLPLEAAAAYRQEAERANIAPIFLAAPTTTDVRLKELDAASSGFLYCVSITGVTGERHAISQQTIAFLRRVRSAASKNPILAGFGIATPADARAMSAMTDGVIIGSAFISHLARAVPGTEAAEARTFVGSVRRALDSGD
jgi:tryptophan synthase alpha chain